MNSDNIIAFVEAETADWKRQDGSMTNAAYDAQWAAGHIARLARNAKRRGAAGISARIALIEWSHDDLHVVREAAFMALRMVRRA